MVLPWGAEQESQFQGHFVLQLIRLYEFHIHDMKFTTYYFVLQVIVAVYFSKLVVKVCDVILVYRNCELLVLD